ncbi:hypothetical protein Droror1_Dr00000955 [Drosera rotundifolia]
MGGGRKKLTPKKKNGAGKKLSPQKENVRDHNVQCQIYLYPKDGEAVDPVRSIERNQLLWGDEPLPPNYVARPLDGSALRPLNCDEKVRKLCTDLKGQSEVDVYVEHTVPLDKEAALDKDQTVEVDKEAVLERQQGVETVIENEPPAQDENEALNKGEQIRQKKKGKQVVQEDAESEPGIEKDQVKQRKLKKRKKKEQVEEEDGDVVSVDDSDYENQWDLRSVLSVDLPIAPIEPPLDFDHVEEDIANPATFSDFADSEGDSSDLESPSEDEEEEDNTQLLQHEQRTEAATEIPVGSQAPQSQNATQSQPSPSQSQPPQRKPRVTKPKPKPNPKPQGQPKKATVRGRKRKIGETSGTK